MRARLTSLPIKTRIALWIGSISTVLLVFMALAVYGVFAQQLVASLDQTVELRSNSYEELIDLDSDPPVLRIAIPDGDLGAGEAVLRLYAADGALLQDASPRSGAAAGEQALVDQVANTQQPALGTIDLSDNEDYRVLARPVGAGPAQVILVSGLELSRVDGPLRLLRIILAIAVPVTAAGASLGGYWVATRALQPVAVMADTARRITGGDLSQRVPGDTAGDELGQLAATFNTMIDRIDETLRRERRFTADASHELRTPLAAIDATIDVTLARPRDESAYRAALSDVRAQANRLAQLTGQLLLLSRLDALEFRANFEPVDLDDVLEAVSAPFLMATPPLALTIESSGGGHEVQGDFELLARAFFNIIDNAAKHGGPAVSMSIHLDRRDNWQVVRLVDNGPGIPAAFMPTMFERFRRGDAARSTPGAGLGLSIVEAIVEVHGGSISAEPSTPAGGTTIVVRLPAVITPKAG
jgi:signal transduction histidine kinase